MSWEHELFELFDDLEAQADAAWQVDREAEVADRARTEYATVSLASRLMASRGRAVSLELPHVGRVQGELTRVGADWCLVVGRGQDWIVPLAAISAVRGTNERAVPEVAWSPLDRLSLRSALRRVADAGARSLLHLSDGARHEGYVERVGADFLEAIDPAGSPLLVPYAALLALQRRDG